MHNTYLRQSAQQIRSKIAMAVAVLILRTIPNAIGQDRFQLVEILSPNIWSNVNDDAGYMLPHALPQQPRLAKIERDTLIGGDRPHQHHQPLSTPSQFG